MGKYYDLILLDSGYSRFEELDKEKVDVYELDGDEWNMVEVSEDLVGHGTSVMSLISSDYDGKFAVFKVFTSMTLSNIENILRALNYILDKNIECKIVQMSFGVRGYDRRLEDICRRLVDKDILIIAAYDNCGAMSYPAAFDFVIGVSGNPLIKRKDQFNVQSNSLVDIYAKSGKQIVATSSRSELLPAEGNSYATSYVSLALLKSGKPLGNKERAMKLFDPNYQNITCENDFDKLEGRKAAVFPLNKEVYSLINYSELLKIELVDVYDIKYSSNIGRQVSNIKGDKSYQIKNIEKCEYDNFDTLIIGHVRELSNLLKKDIKRQLLEQCLVHRKNVYCFDQILVEEYKAKFEQENLILTCADDYNLRYKEGRLFQVKTPVLAVVGTNKKQGKFTLQMQIKKVLEEKNVNLGVLGTEPVSMLLGCDDILPLGYDSNISNQKAQYIIEAFNEKIHNIDVRDKDLILVGGQSGFLPHITFNIGHININQFAFLYGVLPDGVILSFTDTDDVDYVKKAIAAIESVYNIKVFLLALYAFHTENDYVINVTKRKLTQEEVSEIKKKYKDSIGLDVIVSGDTNDNELLFSSIVDYFCEEEE